MDTYFYYFNHGNNQANHHLSGDCSCSCFTCLYKLDLIFLLIVIYLLLMDKITININTNGQLPLVPMDNNNNDNNSDQFDISVDQDQQSSSSSSSADESKSSSQTNESPESLNSTVSSSSTISIGRKLIKPEISLDFLDLSDDEENCDSEDSESSEDFARDVSLSEENFPNSRLSTIRISSKSFNCQQNHRHSHSHHQHFGVKRQSSLDSSDSISWDESGESGSSSSGYSSLPCNLIDNVYVHEAAEVNCPFNLSLTFTELGHIRKALAREELDSMSFTQTVREQLIRGKLCSTCLKTRFKLFGPWADCCRLCERPVCSRCSSNVQINAKRYNSIPIQLLVPNNNQRKIIKSTQLNSSSSSSISSTTTVIAKIKVTDGHHHDEKQSSINTEPTSLSSSSSSSLNHHNQMKESKYSRLRLKSLPWIRKTSSSHSNISDEDNPSPDDDNNNHQHSMLIKLCLDCELFFLSMLTI